MRHVTDQRKWRLMVDRDACDRDHLGSSVSGMTLPGKRGARAVPTALLWSVLAVMFTILMPLSSLAADRPAVEMESVQVAPATVMPGAYPDIVANIRMRPGDRGTGQLQINVIAVLTWPDHRTRSWIWKKIMLAPGERKAISLPKEYDTKQIGEHRIEFAVYSADMRRRLAVLARTFMVSDKPQAVEKPAVPEVAKRPVRPPEPEGYAMGIGLYANGLNPAGGATVLVWPSKNLGVQASYTVGTFTSYEVRLLGRMTTESGWNPYLGVGYIGVSTKADVIGLNTTFTDSTVSGVLGMEVQLSKGMYGYVELIGAGIDLKKIVTNGGTTAEATVEYAPVSIGVGLVFPLF